MHLTHVACVWGNRQAKRVGRITHAQHLGDACHARDIGLDPRDRLLCKKFSERISRVQLLTQRHGDGREARKLRVAFDVVIPQRLFKPINV